ncbi:hypothetical protein JD844_024497 [Phrynosoma platyrhinos]|uniref:Syntaxin-7 n=1 Tax=Phrynosoma platyrhinos TaxID=52577 RepID=A0ABQ7SYC4_PHRPL|nr:hypothetical protein JD844_024497 [Phrynosoma platyrhinos]
MAYNAGITVDPNQLAQRITSNIQKITQCTAEIQRVLNQLGTQDTHELRQQLQREHKLHCERIGRQRKIQKDRLVNEFTTALTNFQRVQRQAAEKERELVARVRASSRVSGGAPEESYREGTLVSWDRHQSLPDSYSLNLNADILDINEIFKDLGMMIHEQGDVIDSIEANVETAEVHVQQANQQLSRAADYQVNNVTNKNVLLEIFFLFSFFDSECKIALDQQLEKHSVAAAASDSEKAVDVDVVHILLTLHLNPQDKEKKSRTGDKRKSRKKMCILIVALVLGVTILGLIIWGVSQHN